MKYLNEFITQLKNDKVPMNPCKCEELNAVKEMIGNKKLPKAYIEFLETMGRGTNHTFLRGESCFVDELLILNNGAIELLEENDFPQKLTENDFVFWMSQGCMFSFFRLNEGENPPIYFYSESTQEEDFYKITDSFTDFLCSKYAKDKYLFEKKNK